MTDLLPAISHDGPVAVITNKTTIPGIVQQLKPVQVDRDEFNNETKRYAALQGELTPAEKAVRAAHDALEEQRILVDLDQILRKREPSRFGGYYPRLAIAHLTDKTVYCRVHRGGQVEFRGGRSGRKVFFDFTSSEEYGRWTDSKFWVQRQATVPVLPPELERRVDKKNPKLLLLWEATWEDEVEKRPRPPIDPALLEHVAGSLYAVEAVWELSAVEAAALGRPAR